MIIDYERDKSLDEFSKKTLQDRYMLSTEKSPQDAFARAAIAFADDEEHAQRMYDYWFTRKYNWTTTNYFKRFKRFKKKHRRYALFV